MKDVDSVKPSESKDQSEVQKIEKKPQSNDRSEASEIEVKPGVHVVESKAISANQVALVPKIETRHPHLRQRSMILESGKLRRVVRKQASQQKLSTKIPISNLEVEKRQRYQNPKGYSGVKNKRSEKDSASLSATRVHDCIDPKNEATKTPLYGTLRQSPQVEIMQTIST